MQTGRKLKQIECHDIVCKTAEIVVVGGVRRSALISLSDLNDREIRFANLVNGGNKTYNEQPQIIRLIIKKNQTLVLSCESGYPSTILNLGNEESITVCRPNEL